LVKERGDGTRLPRHDNTRKQSSSDSCDKESRNTIRARLAEPQYRYQKPNPGSDQDGRADGTNDRQRGGDRVG